MEAAVSNQCLSGILGCHLLDLGHPPKPTPTLQKSGAGINHSLCLGNCKSMESIWLVWFWAKEAYSDWPGFRETPVHLTAFPQFLSAALRLCCYAHQFDGVICIPVPDDVPGGQATFCVSRSLFGPFPHLLQRDWSAVLIKKEAGKWKRGFNLSYWSDTFDYQISQES